MDVTAPMVILPVWYFMIGTAGGAVVGAALIARGATVYQTAAVVLATLASWPLVLAILAIWKAEEWTSMNDKQADTKRDKDASTLWAIFDARGALRGVSTEKPTPEDLAERAADGPLTVIPYERKPS